MSSELKQCPRRNWFDVFAEVYFHNFYIKPLFSLQLTFPRRIDKRVPQDN